MSETVVRYDKKAGAIKVVDIEKQTPLKKIYGLIGVPIEQGQPFSSTDIKVKLEDYDETAAAPSGRQFGSAKVMCDEDGKTTLYIPSKQYNLELPLDFTNAEVCDETKEAELNKEADEESSAKTKKMQLGVENSYIKDAFGIITTGKLADSDGGGFFDYGTSHISPVAKQYGDADFDVMDFINDKLMEVDADRVIIPFEDVKSFKASIADCGGDNCNGKGFIKPDKAGNIHEDGYVLVGTHEDTGTPIYAIKGAVRVKSLDANGDEIWTKVKLLDSGMMLFARKNTIIPAFGGLQTIVNKKFSLPKKIKWRMFMTVNEKKGLVKANLQSGLTPILPSSKNIELVTGLK